MKRFFNKLLIGLVVGAVCSFLGGLSLADSSLPCNAGIEAFKKNVHPLLMQKCTQCHSSHGPGPQHSVADVLTSYQKVKPYVDFLNISNSVFATKGGNGHCKSYSGGNDYGLSQSEIESALQKWWNEGENSCALQGAVVTSQKPLPQNLPLYPDKNTATLAWDLGEINPLMKGVIAAVDVQQYSLKNEMTLESYRFKRPTVFSADKPVKVKGLKILLNGAYDPFANGFNSLNLQTSGQMQAPFTVSPRTQIIMAEKGALKDKVSLAFDEIEYTTPLTCKSVSEFQKNMAEMAQSCQSCHSKTGSKAQQKFDLSGSAEQICGQFLLRVNKDFVGQSPLILYALGHDGHQAWISPANGGQDVLDKLKTWLTFEEPINSY